MAGFYENLLNPNSACSISEHMNEHFTQNRARVSALPSPLHFRLGQASVFKIFSLLRGVLKSSVTLRATS